MPNSPVPRPSSSGGSGTLHCSKQLAAASKTAWAPLGVSVDHGCFPRRSFRFALTPPLISHARRRTRLRRVGEDNSSRPGFMDARSKSANATSSEARARSARGTSVQAPAPNTSIPGDAPGWRPRKACCMSVEHCSRCCGLCWRSHSRRCAPCVCPLL